MKFRNNIITTFSIALAILAVGFVSDKAKADNPIIQNIFAPDPAPMVYDDTVYLYTTHDEDETVGGFYTMLNWHCFSTKDMVNWTSHGQIFSLDDLSWANDRAWAAQCIEKDGKFYLYVPVKATNSGICIGVGVSDSPTGPFVDAIGGPLIDEGDWNDIDPTVYIDDDGQAYLYFGNPELRYVKLNDDMISYDKSVGVVKVPMTEQSFGPSADGRSCSYAEGPWFYKRNDLYYMVYPAFGASGGENISYSTSESPTGPWEFGGVILSPNNCYTIHPGVIDYKGRSFLFYHGNPLDKTSSFHRSTSIEEIFYDEDGGIPPTEQTAEGVTSVQNLNPYERVEAETMAWESGVEVQRNDDGSCNLYSIHDKNFVKVKDVDFGEKGPIGLNVSVACADEAAKGTIEFRIGCDEDINSTTSNAGNWQAENFDIHNTDVESGEVIAYVDVEPTGGADEYKTISVVPEKAVTGVHDLFIVFRGETSGELYKVDYWQFEKEPDPTPVPTAEPTAAPVTPTAAPSQATPAADAEVTKPAKVKSLKLKKKGKKAVVVSWKKISDADKYEIVYGTNKKLKKSIKVKVTAKTKITIKKLKMNKVYYFKVRAYKTNGSEKAYGAYSAKKKIKL